MQDVSLGGGPDGVLWLDEGLANTLWQDGCRVDGPDGVPSRDERRAGGQDGVPSRDERQVGGPDGVPLRDMRPADSLVILS